MVRENNELEDSNVTMYEQLNHMDERYEQLYTKTDASLDTSEVLIGLYVGEPATKSFE